MANRGLVLQYNKGYSVLVAWLETMTDRICAGAVYHLTSRGNVRQAVFLDVKDFWYFFCLFGNALFKNRR